MNQGFKKKFFLFLLIVGFSPLNVTFSCPSTIFMTDTISKPLLLQLSQDFLQEVRSGNLQLATAMVSNISVDDLLKHLLVDEEKMIFWIHMYNGWFQILAQSNNQMGKKIFSLRKIAFATRNFTLDEIEHGILRKYRWKYSRGYFANLFRPKLIKDLAVEVLDYRVHFALNCGAKSCPPILSFKPQTLENQLTNAKINFIKSETQIDTASKRLTTSKIFSWFLGDFGGKNGIRKMMSEVYNQDFSDYKIAFTPYDWTQKLGYYAEK